MQLATINPNNCDITTCALADQCPVGPTPGIPCSIKEGYITVVSRDIMSMFPKVKNNPTVQLRINYLLVPLFEQLLNIKMTMHVHSRVLMGRVVNPLFRETRSIIEMISKELSTIDKSAKESFSEMETIKGGESYYDMLFTEGVPSVNSRVGVKPTTN